MTNETRPLCFLIFCKPHIDIVQSLRKWVNHTTRCESGKVQKGLDCQVLALRPISNSVNKNATDWLLQYLQKLTFRVWAFSVFRHSVKMSFNFSQQTQQLKEGIGIFGFAFLPIFFFHIPMSPPHQILFRKLRFLLFFCSFQRTINTDLWFVLLS